MLSEANQEIELRNNDFFCENCQATFTEKPHATGDGYWLCDPCWNALCHASLQGTTSDLELLAAEAVEICNLHGWSLHWTGRAAALHLESSELIEAVRGKRGDPIREAGDVLFVLLSILRPKGITFASVITALQRKVIALRAVLHNAGEQKNCEATIMGNLYTAASVVVDNLSIDLSGLRSENRLMRSVVDAAIAYTVEFKTGMTSEALQRLAVAVNAYKDGRLESGAADSVRATARAAVEHLNKEGCWLLSDATPKELEQITEIIAGHFCAAATAAPQEPDTRPSCWHCGVVLAYAPRLRCGDCPDECDVEGCDELGCATAAPQSQAVASVARELLAVVRNYADERVSVTALGIEQALKAKLKELGIEVEAGTPEEAERPPKCKLCGHAGMLTREGICTHHDLAKWQSEERS